MKKSSIIFILFLIIISCKKNNETINGDKYIYINFNGDTLNENITYQLPFRQDTLIEIILEKKQKTEGSKSEAVAVSASAGTILYLNSEKKNQTVYLQKNVQTKIYLRPPGYIVNSAIVSVKGINFDKAIHINFDTLKYNSLSVFVNGNAYNQDSIYKRWADGTSLVPVRVTKDFNKVSYKSERVRVSCAVPLIYNGISATEQNLNLTTSSNSVTFFLQAPAVSSNNVAFNIKEEKETDSTVVLFNFVDTSRQYILTVSIDGAASSSNIYERKAYGMSLTEIMLSANFSNAFRQDDIITIATTGGSLVYNSGLPASSVNIPLTINNNTAKVFLKSSDAAMSNVIVSVNGRNSYIPLKFNFYDTTATTVNPPADTISLIPSSYVVTLPTSTLTLTSKFKQRIPQNNPTIKFSVHQVGTDTIYNHIEIGSPVQTFISNPVITTVKNLVGVTGTFRAVVELEGSPDVKDSVVIQFVP